MVLLRVGRNRGAGKLMRTAQEQGTGVNYSEMVLHLHLHSILSLERYANFGLWIG